MKYYHNPRCSKSRQGLTFLPSSVEIILYLKEEVSAFVYRSLLQRYDGNLLDLLRIQESPAKGLDLKNVQHRGLGRISNSESYRPSTAHFRCWRINHYR